jgi:hypothetical protein
MVGLQGVNYNAFTTRPDLMQRVQARIHAFLPSTTAWTRCRFGA